MQMRDAIEALGALAHETRLKVFRLLVRAGPAGLSAGTVAARLGANASTMSHHLAILERAGLLKSWRVQRRIFYAADFEGMRGLLAYLMHDCCQGLPDGEPLLPETEGATR